MSEELKIFTLGEFKVKKNDKLISPYEKINDKPWLLFKYLFTERGKNIHPEIIINDLWPNQYIKDPKHTITNLVYRLRKYLKIDSDNEEQYIINCKGRCCFNKQSNYWLDIDEFIKLCDKANIIKEENPYEAISIYKKAVSLYKGDYLSEIPYHDWVIQSRNTYHWLFIEHVLDYISLLMDNEKYGRVVSLCEKCFEIEPFEEELHINYIESLLNLERIAHARSHYNYANDLFNKKLEISNFPKLELIFEKKSNQNYLTLIKNKLDKRENIKGAFICKNDIFRMIYKLEKRRAERRVKPIFLCIIKFFDKNICENNRYLIEGIIEKLLRKGDIITKWDEEQYLLLLLDLTKKETKMVLDRIVNTLCKELNINNDNIIVEYKQV